MSKRSVTFNHNPLLAKGLPVWRPRVVLLALLCGSFALVARAAYLQGVNDEFLQAKGESRYARVIEIPATRGKITDRHGTVLAASTPVKSIWAIPGDAKLTPAEVRKLAGLLDMDARDLSHRLGKDGDFVYLKRQVPPEVAERVAEMKLAGIHEQREYRRYYPGAEVMSHLLGFTGVDDHGQEGVELAFDRQLTGKPGSRRVIKDRRGRIVEDVESIRTPQEGQDIALSVDAKIQYLAYAALQSAMDTYRAKAGGVVVLDARSGEVLAMVNAPSYNPNNRESLSGAQLRNRALTDTFEPGSVVKPIIAAMALESGKFRFDTVIDTGNGRMALANATISDTKPHGRLTVAEVIQKSSNIGAVRMAMSFEPQQMWRVYDEMGFGSAVGLGFPGEASGRLRAANQWRPIEQATMAYGYGLSASLMQVARSYLVFARDGEMIPVTLTRADAPPPAGRRVFSAQTVRETRAMMEMVTQAGGTAVHGQVPGYRVAGKTGTSHKLEGANYTSKYIASFVGLAPVSDPRLVVAVMIDEPSGKQYYGGQVAGPVFARVMGGALRALSIPPDAPVTPMQVARGKEEPTAARGRM
ncbi:peptidoglycan D,D-transpeptidase FtsI family protein [Denitromonas iodatirespirans]|uniref:Peptidoglycan D,D-transpeptidase FtsI n=1 Tax=Denitromonas iodatirespirans TaxID=2795389 RepID=A0A944H8N1_DENI1|nr:penicillin-binding protein 2 [Denitromonas iodatirespirans]MBT0962498.1 penicillin-binding protein 2 [Denitromonas iodatirespirans]